MMNFLEWKWLRSYLVWIALVSHCSFRNCWLVLVLRLILLVYISLETNIKSIAFEMAVTKTKKLDSSPNCIARLLDKVVEHLYLNIVLEFPFIVILNLWGWVVLCKAYLKYLSLCICDSHTVRGSRYGQSVAGGPRRRGCLKEIRNVMISTCRRSKSARRRRERFCLFTHQTRYQKMIPGCKICAPGVGEENQCCFSLGVQ